MDNIFVIQTGYIDSATILGYTLTEAEAQGFINIYNINRGHDDSAYVTEVEPMSKLLQPKVVMKKEQKECPFFGTSQFCKVCGQHRDYHSLAGPSHGEIGHKGNPGNCASCHAEEFGGVDDPLSGPEVL
jgi:hypothetical protein